jgi:NAD(P)-dependent dehydrogenase (short-subunit alcohol dehydrogenase family)
MQQIGAINSADLLAEVAHRRPLLGRVAVVTGGSRGIGAAIARAFVDAGGCVVLVGRDHGALGRVREELHAAGGAASVEVADVTALPEVDQLFESVGREFGRLDILVNAAGGTRRGPAIEMTEADWDAVQIVNLKAAFLCSQRAARIMRSAGSGAIINVASLNSTIGNAWAASYAASKGGIAQLTKSLALEWADLGIRVNAIGPGFIDTEMTAPLLKDDARRERILSHIPMARFGTSDEVGGLAVYLASDASSYVTGQVMYADGGYLCV